MGFFKRKKDEEIKIQLEREALDQLNGNHVEIFEIPDSSSNNNLINSDWKISGKTKAPHTITAEELNSKAHKSKTDNSDIITEEIPMSKSEKNDSSPSDFLYQKMMQSRIAISDDAPKVSTAQIDSFNIPEEKIEEATVEESYVPLDIDSVIDELKNSANPIVKETKTEESFIKKANIPSASDALKTNSEPTNIKATVSSANNEDISKIGANAEERRATLLARCNAYLEDDAGVTKVNTEKYKLESVESILEGFEARAAERVNKKFNTASTTNTTPSPIVVKQPITSETIKPDLSKDTVIFSKPVSSQNPTLDDTRIIPNSKPVKHIFTASTDTNNNKTNNTNDFSSTRIISDISSSSKSIDIYSSQKTTVLPVIESISDTSKSDSNNSDIDNIKENNETKVADDYKTIADRERILTLLLHKKRVFTIKSILCFFAFIISLMLLTPISEKIISSDNTTSIIDFVICLFALFVNLNVLADIKSLFNPKAKTGLPAALILIATTLFSVINLIFKSDFSGFSAVMVFSLLSYNFANRNFYSKTIKNFKIIANPEFKKAVSIVQNKNATKAIVGNSIEGSALICYGGEATNIRNFLRYTYCRNPISEKIQKLSLICIIMGSGLALATLFLGTGNGIYSMYIFTAAVCFSAIPSVYHIVTLTINSANKRLNHYDAMITGYRAADELELCNGIAISSDALFPDGTIRLVDMKLLSPNPFDQSILDAAAIATAIHSPLAGIFKQMDTSKSYDFSKQQVDSVIYEEKMGISGWVDDRRVFVGNRDLLIAHGFTGLPPAELDKKIMRKGYFPIYIASDNIPCALLVVKYEPDENIVYEMQRLANTGTTIIVDNCDPNINAKMLADYFGLYSETVFVMSKQGSDFYKALTPHKEHRNAGAAYKSRIEGLLAALTASINIKKYISRMGVFYVCSIILSLLAVTACIFSSLTQLITPFNILIFQLLMMVITLLPPLLRKP